MNDTDPGATLPREQLPGALPAHLLAPEPTVCNCRCGCLTNPTPAPSTRKETP